MNKIFEIDDIEPHLSDGYEIDEIKFNILKIDSLKDRAFNGLQKMKVVSAGNIDERDEYTIKYESDSGDIIAQSVFAIIEDTCYISWIYIVENIRGLGYGNKLFIQTLNKIKNHNVNQIYTLPKSEEANGLLLKHNFRRVENSNYMFKKI